MEKGWLKNHLLNVIHDNLLLAQVFVVIFFFEDYFIIAQNTSLLRATFNFDTISLLPFILFLASIALLKLTWFIWHFAIIFIKNKLWSSGEQVSKKASITTFLLCIFITVYICQINYYREHLCPISAIEHPHYHNLLIGILILIAFICGWMNLMSIDYKETDK
jgi:hypothetical protein